MSFFESFLGGAAQAGTGILQDQMKEEQVQRMAKFQEELAMERQRTINAMNQENAIAAEKRGIENRATERGQIRTEEIADEPRRRESKVADYKASKMAEYDPQIQELQRKAETEKLTAIEQAKLDYYNKNEKGIIAQKKAMTRAGHIDDGAGLRAIQIQAANMTLDEKKAATKLLNDYEAATDPAVKARLRESLVLRGVIKPSDGEGGTEKVTEKTTDPVTGKEITIERKQRMGAGSGKMEDVTVNGKVIGQASNEAEARDLLKKHKAGNAVATAEKKAAFPAQSGSHGAEVAKPTANVNAQIQDRMMRLKLQGISEETKIRLMQEIEELKRGGSLFSSLTNR